MRPVASKVPRANNKVAKWGDERAMCMCPDMLPDEVDDVVDGKDADDVVGVLI